MMQAARAALGADVLALGHRLARLGHLDPLASVWSCARAAGVPCQSGFCSQAGARLDATPAPGTTARPTPSTPHTPSPIDDAVAQIRAAPDLPALTAILSPPHATPPPLTPRETTEAYFKIAHLLPGITPPGSSNHAAAMAAATTLTPYFNQFLPRLHGPHLATICLAFSRLQKLPPGIKFHAIWQQLRAPCDPAGQPTYRNLNSCGPGDLDRIAAMMIRCNVGTWKQLAEVLDRLVPLLPRLAPNVLIRLATTLGKHDKLTHTPVMDGLAEALLPEAPQASLLNVTGLLGAFAACRHQPSNGLLSALIARLTELIHEIAAAPWHAQAALIRPVASSERDQGLAEDLARGMDGQESTAVPSEAAHQQEGAVVGVSEPGREQAGAAAGTTRAGDQGGDEPEKQQRAAAHLRSIWRKQLPRALWACAVLGHRDDDFLAAACARLAPELRQMVRMEEFDQLQMALWGVGQLGYHHPGLLRASCEVVPPLARRMSAATLARLMDVWARLGYYNAEVVAMTCRLIDSQCRRKGHVTAAQMATMLQAMAMMNHSEPHLFTMAAEYITAELHKVMANYEQRRVGKRGGVDPDLVAAALWAYCRSRQYDGGLTGAVEAYFLQDNRQRVCVLSSEGAARLLWALSSMHRFHPDLYRSLYRRLAAADAAARAAETGSGGAPAVQRKPLQQYGTQRRLYITAVGQASSHGSEVLVAEERGLEPLGVEEKCQVFYSVAGMRQWAELRQAGAPEVDQQLLERCREAWEGEATRQLLSQDQGQLMEALGAMGLDPRAELLLTGNSMRLDVQVTVNGKPTAITFDRKSKLVSSWPYLLPHMESAPNEELGARGVAVVRLPQLEWRRCNGQGSDRLEERMQLLRRWLHSSGTAKVHAGGISAGVHSDNAGAQVYPAT